MDDSMFEKFKEQLDKESYKNKFQSTFTLKSDDKKIESYVESDKSKFVADLKKISEMARVKFEDAQKENEKYMRELALQRHPNNRNFTIESSLAKLSGVSIFDIFKADEILNFLDIYLSKYNFRSSGDEIALNLSKSSFLVETIKKLFNDSITLEMLQNIIRENRPIISFGGKMDNFRRNLIFIDVYCELIDKNYFYWQSPGSPLSLKIKKHFLRALIYHPLFEDLPCCLYLQKEFNKNISTEKLQVIKYFNTVVLNSLKQKYSNQNLNFNWIESINSQYRNLFGNRYDDIIYFEHNSFMLFSKLEFEMVAFILANSIKSDDGFPVMLQEEIDYLLNLYDFNLGYFETIQLELEKLFK